MDLYIQRIAIIAIILGSILAAPFIGVHVSAGNLKEVGLIIGFFFAIAFFFGLKDNVWILVPCGYALGWSFSFIPGAFNSYELSAIFCAGYMFLVYGVMERRGLRVGPIYLFAPLAILVIIFLWHWYSSGAGLRILGGASYGGRRHFLILMSLMPYLFILTVCHKPESHWWFDRLPMFMLFCGFMGAVPQVVTTYVPSLTPYVQFFTGAANLEVYRSQMSETGGDGIGRISALRSLGIQIQLALLCYVPLRKWWRLEYFWAPLLTLFACYLVMRGGFRSSLFLFFLASGIVAFLQLRFKSLVFIPLGALFLGLMIAGHGTFFDLPKSMQRTLTMFPGQWDRDVVHSAESSNNFRDEITEIYWREFADENLLIGSGYKVDPRAVDEIQKELIYGQSSYDFHKGFIIRKDPHEGFISMHQTTGYVGTVVSLFLCCAVIYYVIAHMRFFKPEVITPLQMYAIAFLAMRVGGFFLVFGSMNTFIRDMALFAALLVASVEIAKYRLVSQPVVDEVSAQGVR